MSNRVGSVRQILTGDLQLTFHIEITVITSVIFIVFNV